MRYELNKRGCESQSISHFVVFMIEPPSSHSDFLDLTNQCIFKMTLFLQYIKRFLDVSIPNSQIILNTTSENNPLSHKLPFFNHNHFDTFIAKMLFPSLHILTKMCTACQRD